MRFEDQLLQCRSTRRAGSCPNRQHWTKFFQFQLVDETRRYVQSLEMGTGPALQATNKTADIRCHIAPCKVPQIGKLSYDPPSSPSTSPHLLGKQSDIYEAVTKQGPQNDRHSSRCSMQKSMLRRGSSQKDEGSQGWVPVLQPFAPKLLACRCLDELGLLRHHNYLHVR